MDEGVALAPGGGPGRGGPGRVGAEGMGVTPEGEPSLLSPSATRGRSYTCSDEPGENRNRDVSTLPP